jgi:hypothetical protein
MPPAARDLFEKRSLDPQKLLVRRKMTTMEDTDKKEESPPILKSWRNLYLVVLVHLIAWITFLAFFTRIFK